jgi:membrane protein
VAILQAILTLISRSAGKVLNAIFGWAVRALFGQTSSRAQTFLSAVVAAAVAWPILLVGLIAPKLAALLLAFVPIPHFIPAWAVRLVWLGLALLTPLAVGLAVAAKAPRHAPPESFAKRTLRGFPITIGLAAAFIIMFVSVPVMRFAALVRRLQSADVPLVTTADSYEEVTEIVTGALSRHGLALRRVPPGWWVAAPIRILTWFGGEAFRAYVPSRPAHFVAPELELSFYPSGVLLRGQKDCVTWTHGLIAETVVHTRGLQTSDMRAQALESELRRLWEVYDVSPGAHAGSTVLLGRLDEVTRDLGKLAVPFEDWQVLYRQILQVGRALRGERQVLDQAAPKEIGNATKEGGAIMTPNESLERRPLDRLGTSALVRRLVTQVETLAKKEIELGKTELRADLHKEARAAGGLGIAAVVGIITVALFLVTAIFALALVLPGWAAGLIVSGATLLVAVVLALASWGRRVREPLARTRQSMKENVKWTRERLA